MSWRVGGSDGEHSLPSFLLLRRWPGPCAGGCAAPRRGAYFSQDAFSEVYSCSGSDVSVPIHSRERARRWVGVVWCGGGDGGGKDEKCRRVDSEGGTALFWRSPSDAKAEGEWSAIGHGCSRGCDRTESLGAQKKTPVEVFLSTHSIDIPTLWHFEIRYGVLALDGFPPVPEIGFWCLALLLLLFIQCQPWNLNVGAWPGTARNTLICSRVCDICRRLLCCISHEHHLGPDYRPN